MKDNIKIITPILITFLLMYATSFLLDLELVNKSITRIVITVMLMLVELYLGVVIFKDQLKS